MEAAAAALRKARGRSSTSVRDVGSRSQLSTLSSQPEVVFYPFPGKLYTRQEIADIFAQFGPLDPVIIALRLICQVRFEAAAREAAVARQTDREAAHAGGRCEEIISLRDEILRYVGTGC